MTIPKGNYCNTFWANPNPKIPHVIGLFINHANSYMRLLLLNHSSWWQMMWSGESWSLRCEQHALLRKNIAEIHTERQDRAKLSRRAGFSGLKQETALHLIDLKQDPLIEIRVDKKSIASIGNFLNVIEVIIRAQNAILFQIHFLSLCYNQYDFDSIIFWWDVYVIIERQTSHHCWKTTYW